MISTLF
ncbi:putative pilus assembly protein, partial [Yersinia pestis PY-113]